MRPDVDIVLATFNGAAYLADQLDSIASQTQRGWRVLAADDGSSDGTIDVLERFRRSWPDGRLVILPQAMSRLGASASFGRLLEASTAQYVCMCDQDDVWLPERLETTIELVQRCERDAGGAPVLVHSDLAVVDDSLRDMSPSLDRYQRLGAAHRNQLRQLLVQNSVTGCTTAMNRHLVELALPIPAAAVMHDWWLALVAAAFGVVAYEPRTLVKYRQHQSNVLGARKPLTGLSAMPSEMRGSLDRTYRQAVALYQRFEARMPPESARVTLRYAEIPTLGPFARRKRVFTGRYFKVGFLRTIGMLTIM